MNIDIRLSLEFFDHPKVGKLEKRLGLEGVFCLLKLWAWTAKNRSGGKLAGLDEEDVEFAARWNGEDGKLVATLLDLRLLEEQDGVFFIHDWEEHQAYASKSDDRSSKAKKAAAARWSKAKEEREADASNARPMLTDATSINEHAFSNAPETRNQEPVSNTPLTPHGGDAFGDAGDSPLAEQTGSPDGGKPRAQRKRFVPPTVEEVAAYCRERQNGIDPEAFVDFYMGKGWLVGKSPMKDWRAAVRTWEHERRSQSRPAYQMPIN